MICQQKTLRKHEPPSPVSKTVGRKEHRWRWGCCSSWSRNWRGGWMRSPHGVKIREWRWRRAISSWNMGWGDSGEVYPLPCRNNRGPLIQKVTATKKWVSISLHQKQKALSGYYILTASKRKKNSGRVPPRASNKAETRGTSSLCLPPVVMAAAVGGIWR